MKRLSVLSLSAMLAMGLASLPSSTVAQQKSLKEQLVGAWTLISCNNTTANGDKAPYCVNPKGILIHDASGQYAVMGFGGGRANATAPGAAANFGTWSVNEADKTTTLHYVGALNPTNEGMELKLSVSPAGDEVKFVGVSGAIGERAVARVDQTYRRAK
jgi:hypothetical protein